MRKETDEVGFCWHPISSGCDDFPLMSLHGGTALDQVGHLVLLSSQLLYLSRTGIPEA